MPRRSPKARASAAPAPPAPSAAPPTAAELGRVERGELPVSELATMAAPYNPRKISPADLASLRRSISTFGFVEPVVVNRRLGHIVGGHQRVKAAQAEGIATLPVMFVELDAVSERQLNLSLNRISGQWDETALAQVLAELVEARADLELTGFSSTEVESLLKALNADAASASEDDSPAPPPDADAITQPGDLWELGRHRLLCGDSTLAESVARVCDGREIVATLTDPPYGVDLQARTNQRHGKERYRNYKESDGATALRFLMHAPGHALIMTYPISTHFHALSRQLEESTWEFRWHLVWVKDKPTPVLGGTFFAQFESALVCSRKGGPLRLFVPKGTSSAFHVPTPTVREDHPCPRPLALWRDFLTFCSKRSEHVFDAFCGSGTTIMAAEELDRSASCIELSPGFCDSIVARWERATQQRAVRHSTSAPARASA